MQRVFITGGNGLLGRALRDVFTDCVVHAPASSQLDIIQADQVARHIERAQPDIVIHSAAMTHVDECEQDPQSAHRCNILGTENLARVCRAHDIRLVTISTDYVFSGAASRPYTEDDAPEPINRYGHSKLAAERITADLCPDNHIIARVSWLFGSGRRSFVDALVAWGRTSSQSPVRVVVDQRSAPTSTRSVARALRAVLATEYAGIVHLTARDGASRHDLARAVFDVLGLQRPLEPCASTEFPSPARRPANSQLCSVRLPALGLSLLPSWRTELADYLRATYRTGA